MRRTIFNIEDSAKLYFLQINENSGLFILIRCGPSYGYVITTNAIFRC